MATADTAPGARAAATVRQMTADEKVVLTHGIMQMLMPKLSAAPPTTFHDTNSPNRSN